MKLYIRLMALLSAFLLPVAPNAKEIDSETLMETSLEELVNINVSSATTYQQRLQDAPSSASVITREQIRLHGYRTIADALASLPGVYISYDRSYRFIGVRGLSRPGDYNSRVLMLVDGVRVNDNIFNQAYLGTESIVDISRVERIEYIPGPGASIYGDNAFLGVVNVITTPAKSSRNNEAEFTWYNDNTVKVGTEWGTKIQDDGYLKLSADVYDSQGRNWYYKEYGATARNADTDRSEKMMLKYEQGNFELASLIMQRSKRFPTGAYETDFGDTRSRSKDQQFFVSVNWTQALTEAIEARLHADVSGFEYRGNYPTNGVVNQDATEGYRQTTDVRLTGVANQHKWVSGIELIRDSQQKMRNVDLNPFTEYLDVSRQSFKYGVYLQDEWRLSSSWLFNVGARYDHYQTFGGTFNPRAALVFQPSSKSTYKLMYGRAFRAPNVYERFYGGDTTFTNKANPHLQPEFINAFELTWDYQWNRQITTHLGLFRNDMHRLIVSGLDPIDQRYVFNNGLDAVSYGVEMSLDWRIHRWHYLGNMTFQDARNEQTNAWLDNSPRVMTKHLIEYTFNNNWELAFDNYYMSRRLTRAGDTDGFVLSRLHLVRNNILPNTTLMVGVDNLFNAQFGDPTDVINRQDTILQDPRTVRIQFRIQY